MLFVIFDVLTFVYICIQLCIHWSCFSLVICLSQILLPHVPCSGGFGGRGPTRDFQGSTSHDSCSTSNDFNVLHLRAHTLDALGHFNVLYLYIFTCLYHHHSISIFLFVSDAQWSYYPQRCGLRALYNYSSIWILLKQFYVPFSPRNADTCLGNHL